MAEYKTRKNQQKIDAVKEITSEFSEYDGFIFTDYRGMTVEQLTLLRTQLRAQKSAFRVVKNRFAKIALNDLSFKGNDGQLVGPTAVALVKGEDASSAVSKILFEYTKSAPLHVKGGFLSGKSFTPAQIEAYSKLPSRTDLIAMLMGTMKEPVAKLARTLQAVADAKQN